MEPMTEATDPDFSHLPPGAGVLGAVFARPKWLAGSAWSRLPRSAGWRSPSCLPAWARSKRRASRSAAFGARPALLVALMWGAMTLAMMLPSAAPMILTYAEIADTAARKGEPVVSPFVLAAGYTAVWLGFAVVATLAQYAFTRAALLDAGMASVSGLFSGAIFIAAGLYQFSSLKHACLHAMPERRFRFSSPIGRRRRAACSGSASNRACIASAAAGR